MRQRRAFRGSRFCYCRHVLSVSNCLSKTIGSWCLTYRIVSDSLFCVLAIFHSISIPKVRAMIDIVGNDPHLHGWVVISVCSLPYFLRCFVVASFCLWIQNHVVYVWCSKRKTYWCFASGLREFAFFRLLYCIYLVKYVCRFLEKRIRLSSICGFVWTR